MIPWPGFYVIYQKYCDVTVNSCRIITGWREAWTSVNRFFSGQETATQTYTSLICKVIAL